MAMGARSSTADAVREAAAARRACRDSTPPALLLLVLRLFLRAARHTRLRLPRRARRSYLKLTVNLRRRPPHEQRAVWVLRVTLRDQTAAAEVPSTPDIGSSCLARADNGPSLRAQTQCVCWSSGGRLDGKTSAPASSSPEYQLGVVVLVVLDPRPSMAAPRPLPQSPLIPSQTPSQPLGQPPPQCTQHFEHHSLRQHAPLVPLQPAFLSREVHRHLNQLIHPSRPAQPPQLTEHTTFAATVSEIVEEVGSAPTSNVLQLSRQLAAMEQKLRGCAN